MKRSRIISFALAVVMWLSICLPNCLAFAAGPGSDGSEQLITLTINYCLEDSTKQVYESYVAQYPAASQTQYQVTSPKIDGYELVDQGQDTISGILTEDTEYTVEYRFINPTYTYTVIYQGTIPDAGKSIELDRVSGTAPAGKIAIESKEFAGFEKDYTGELSLEVTPDNNASMTVHYTLTSDPYVVFVTGGSYVAPIKNNGVDTAEQIKQIQAPTRDGYAFDCWLYDGQEYTTEQLAELVEDIPYQQIVVEVQWKSGKADYVVQYWKQNIACDGYDLVGSDTEFIESTTGSAIVPTEEMKKKDKAEDGESDCDPEGIYYGFDYAKYDGDQTVAPDGSSVLNIYYDREIWTIKLYNINYGHTDAEGLEQYLFAKTSGPYGTMVPEDAFAVDFDVYYNSIETKGTLRNNAGAWLYGGNQDTAEFVNFVVDTMMYTMPTKYGNYNPSYALAHEACFFPRYSDNPGYYDINIYGETLDGEYKDYELINSERWVYHTTNTAKALTVDSLRGYTWYKGWFEVESYSNQDFTDTRDYQGSTGLKWPKIQISTGYWNNKFPFVNDDTNGEPQTAYAYILASQGGAGNSAVPTCYESVF